MQREQWRGLAYVAFAVFFFSTSPVLALWADPLSPFVKTGLRMAVAALALGSLWATIGGRGAGAEGQSAATAVAQMVDVAGEIGEAVPLDSSPNAVLTAIPSPAAISQSATHNPPSAGRPPAPGPRPPILRFAAYGLVAALHFFCYVASLSYTSPAHSLTLVYTAPVFVALCAAGLLHEPIRRGAWGGIAVAILGVGVLVNPFGDPGAYPQWWLGDLLALGSAMTFGLYSVAGRYERGRTSLFGYATAVYGLAALWLLPGVVLNWPASGGPAISAGAWLAVIVLGLGPLALGHTLYNAALRRLPPTTVNLIATQEVTGGVLLSWLLLGLAPGPTALVGAAITLGGILIVLRNT